jgi:hypothetical protein
MAALGPRAPLRLTRRSVLAGLSAFAVLGLTRARAARAQADQVDEFVGEIPDTPLFVAIAVESDHVSHLRRLTAYVCDGEDAAHLFRGETMDAAFDLVAEDGSARLNGALGPGAVAGAVQMSGGAAGFTAVRTRAFGGLYRTTGLDEFRTSGRSLEGSELELEMTPDLSRLLATVQRPDRSVYRYDRPLPEQWRRTTEYREHWFILLNDGRGRGGRILGSRVPGARFTNVPAG